MLKEFVWDVKSRLVNFFESLVNLTRNVTKITGFESTSWVIVKSPVKNSIIYYVPDLDIKLVNFLHDLLTGHEQQDSLTYWVDIELLVKVFCFF